MSNSYFQFKQFTIQQDQCAMKVTTDACLFGAWVAEQVKNDKGRVMDIGAGTGLLSLMLAQKNPIIEVMAIEIDPPAVEQAGKNIQDSPWASRIKVIKDDSRRRTAQSYDIIISNPPFYEKEIPSANEQRSVALHDQGLTLNQLAGILQKNLKPGGSFFLLLPYKRNAEIRKLFKGQVFTIPKIVLVRQSVDHDFFRVMLHGVKENNSTQETLIEEMSITDDKQKYTAGFEELLKDYYLKF
ncbi:MAG TPA: methyltransferase [Chitinophagaceae bacterium]|nr:methyltransferase [Chitinophagaceae bacterium]